MLQRFRFSWLWFGSSAALVICGSMLPNHSLACGGGRGGGVSSPANFASANVAPPVQQYQMAMQQSYAQQQHRQQQEQTQQYAAAEKAALKQQRKETIARQRAEKEAKLQAQIAARKEANQLAASSNSPSKKSYSGYSSYSR